jgi:hypothetical protein
MKKSHPLIGVGSSFLRSNFDGFVECGDGFCIFAGGLQRLAEIVESIRKFRLNLQRFAEADDGLFVFLFMKVVEAALIELCGLMGNSRTVISVAECSSKKAKSQQ